MSQDEIERLKSNYTDQFVLVDDEVPEYARFAGIVGKVITVNENGKALVDFHDGAWYDVPVKQLVITSKPE